MSVADRVCPGDDLAVFGPGEFDFVVARHNLEHYPRPDRALAEWKRVLKPGGLLGVVVPDDRYVCSLDLDPTHRVSFTPVTLAALFRQGGLEIVRSGVAVRHWSIYLVARKPAAPTPDQAPEIDSRPR